MITTNAPTTPTAPPLGPPILTRPLYEKWVYYYHLPADKNWALSSYTTLLQMETVEDVVALNRLITENIVKHCMLFVMRRGISPMWEDALNCKGGAFSFKVVNKHVFEVWKQLVCYLCGGSLCIDKKHLEFVSGITISPKRQFCIVKIWMLSCAYQNPDIFNSIPNLSNEGCLFKKHGE